MRCLLVAARSRERCRSFDTKGVEVTGVVSIASLEALDERIMRADCCGLGLDSREEAVEATEPLGCWPFVGGRAAAAASAWGAGGLAAATLREVWAGATVRCDTAPSRVTSAYVV